MALPNEAVCFCSNCLAAFQVYGAAVGAKKILVIEEISLIIFASSSQHVPVLPASFVWGLLR
jgi:hypothetical protein